MQYVGARTNQALLPHERDRGSLFSKTAFGALFFAGALGFIIVIYALFIAQLNYSWNLDQNKRDVSIRNGIDDLVIKDMQLTDKDMILMNNVSSLDQRLIEEETERIIADMQLMNNVTNISAIIDIDVQDRIDKDMILMDNMTSLSNQTNGLNMTDSDQLDTLMMKMQNITDLDERLNQAIQDRMDKDMILMDNVTALDIELDVIVTNITMYETEVIGRLDGFNISIQELMDKDMILMTNVTDLLAQITQEGIDRLSTDTVFGIRLDNAEAKCDILEMDLDIMEANVTTLFNISDVLLFTINGIGPDGSGNFNISGPVNTFDNQVMVQTTPALANLSYVHSVNLAASRATFIYEKTHFALENGFRTGAPFAGVEDSVGPTPFYPTADGSPCTASTCQSDIDIECRGPGVGAGNIDRTFCGTWTNSYPLGTFFQWPLQPPHSGKPPNSGGIRLVGKGSFVVDIDAQMCIRMDSLTSGNDVTMGVFMDVGTNPGAGPGAGRVYSYTVCDADISAFDDNWVGCNNNAPPMGQSFIEGVNWDNQCLQPCYPYSLSCTRHIHHQLESDVTHVSARVYGYNNLERRCITARNTGSPVYGFCSQGGSGPRNYFIWDRLRIRFSGTKVF